jgi:hypothetical protein
MFLLEEQFLLLRTSLLVFRKAVPQGPAAFPIALGPTSRAMSSPVLRYWPEHESDERLRRLQWPCGFPRVENVRSFSASAMPLLLGRLICDFNAVGDSTCRQLSLQGGKICRSSRRSAIARRGARGTIGCDSRPNWADLGGSGQYRFRGLFLFVLAPRLAFRKTQPSQKCEA